MGEIFMGILTIICNRVVPRKKRASRNRIPKERKKLLGRMKMLKRQRHNEQRKSKQREIEQKIFETEKMLSTHRREEKILKENRMLEGIGKNTKILHDYIKNENRRDNKIGPFKIQGKYPC